MGVKSSLEEHHHLEIEESAVNAGVNWSVRYLPGRALPDKALSILDLASARARRRNKKSVDEAVVAEVIAEMTDMPKERLLQTDQDRMLGLERLLAEQVVGHEQPISRIATILRRNAAGFRNQRPIGSFLLLGPTGVGKTETAKAIASALFHGASAMTRLDLSEFAEPHALARLIGAPPGYIGHEAGGQLTESVRRRPYQVLLLDEFEKAHRDVQQAFLQVFDEGRMTDGRGRTVDFTNTVIVMTSNLGAMEAREAADTRSIGFSRNASSRKDNAKDDVKDAVMAAARSALPPELYNRIDEVLFFESLTRDHVREVARRLLADLSKRLKEARNIVIEWDDAGIDALLDSGGYEPSLGARPVKRAIARFVEAPASEMILRQEIDAGDVLFVGSESGQVLLSRSSPRDN
jgi:ATP-dependent Clp protease ATP-binding subunit ClpC